MLEIISRGLVFKKNTRCTMPVCNGTIKRMTDRGFGFITTAEGTDYFFNQSACVRTRFDELREG